MHRFRYKKVILVAPDIFPKQLTTELNYVRHIADINLLFPTIFEDKPGVIIFDYDFIGNNLEKNIRRIKCNKFYEDVKVICYKSKQNEKIDSFLKAIGVDDIIYNQDLDKKGKNKNLILQIAAAIASPISKLVGIETN